MPHARVLIALAGALALVVVVAPAFAGSPGNPDSWCREGHFTESTAPSRLARVDASQPVAFIRDHGDGCPGEVEACAGEGLAPPGALLVVNDAFGELVCAWYVDEAGAVTVGWLPAGAVVEVARVALDHDLAWIGAWSLGDNALEVHADHRGFYIRGRAAWRGPEGLVHEGRLSGPLAVDGDRARFEDADGCRLALLALDGRLVIDDEEGRCGGVNVSFDGVYRRAP